MPSGLEFGAAFLVGLLGSGHCIAMCGGIATALELAVVPAARSRAACRAGYQAGRLAGYAAAGALAGGLGAGVFKLAAAHSALLAARWIQALMLILLGLYLSGVWRGPLAALERAGAHAWRALSPLRRRLLPVRGVSGAVRMGLLWGFLPCGLVYSALALALASGSVAGGAATMLAFGAGTLPAVLLLASVARRATRPGAGLVLRRAAGVLILFSGVLMAAGAARMG
jgi:sulfite exporter TauE/SafE